MALRVNITKPATAIVEQLSAKHGELIFHQSGVAVMVSDIKVIGFNPRTI